MKGPIRCQWLRNVLLSKCPENCREKGPSADGRVDKAYRGFDLQHVRVTGKVERERGRRGKLAPSITLERGFEAVKPRLLLLAALLYAL
jgi:hypothetical protein